VTSRDSPAIVADVFDSDIAGGPVVVLNSGNILLPATEPPRQIAHELRTPVKLAAVAPSGNSFVLSTAVASPPNKPSRHCLVKLRQGDGTIEVDVSHAHGQPVRIMDPAIGAFSQRTLRVRFQAVSVFNDRLALLTAKGAWLVLYWHFNGGFSLTRCMITENLDALYRSFRRMPSPPGVGYRLRCAEWADGSRAILDSRGLLHLQSSAPAIPECTIVLCDDNDVTVWCADGSVWGSEYFLGQNVRQTDHDDIMGSVIFPFVTRLK
jgi:hypothetical protein